MRRTVTPSRLELADPLPDQVAGLRIEAGRRLVEHQQPRPVEERPREDQPPLHPPGQLADLRPRLLLQSCTKLQQLVRRGACASAAGDAEVAGVDEEVLLDGEVRVEVVLLGADPDPGLHLARGSAVTSRPKTRTVPAVIGVKQVTIRTVVVFPAPFGPRNPTHSAGRTSKSTPSTAVRAP